MGAPYDNIPGIDSSDMFHPDIRTALANAPELMAAFAAKIHTHAYSDVVVTELGTEDLNTVTNQGLYGQGNTAEATLVTNYPVAVAGLLEVTKFINGAYTFIFQKYTTYNAPVRTFTRTFYTANNWSAWVENQSLIAAGTTAQYYRGDKTWQTLNKAAVGLSVVDNVSVIADYVPYWKANTAYLAGQVVISPSKQIVTSKTARTSGATWNSAEIANWSGQDEQMTFKNAGFNWAGGASPWDAGPLDPSTAVESSSQRSAYAAFAVQGAYSGSIKFTEPGVYDVIWRVNPTNGNPGYRQYSIVAVDESQWSATGPDGLWRAFGSTYTPDNNVIWETHIIAANIRVPVPNLTIRFTGQQGNATSNTCSVKLFRKALV
jgi:hypothetical protein